MANISTTNTSSSSSHLADLSVSPTINESSPDELNNRGNIIHDELKQHFSQTHT